MGRLVQVICMGQFKINPMKDLKSLKTRGRCSL
jgi:hypothetical protein